MQEVKIAPGGVDEASIIEHYNVNVIFCAALNRVLVQRKKKGPYPDKLNLPGGKTEKGEDPMYAAYREIFEETHLMSSDIMPLGWLGTLLLPSGWSEGIIALDVFYTRLVQSQKMKQVPKKNDIGEDQWWEPKTDLRKANATNLAGDGDIPYFVYLAECRLRQEMGLSRYQDKGYVGTL